MSELKKVSKSKIATTYALALYEAAADKKAVSKVYDDIKKLQAEISKDADFISRKIDEAVKVIEAGNAKDIKSLSKSEKDKLKTIASAISSNTDVKVTVAKGGEVTIYNTDGTVFTKVSEPIKYTNDNNALIISLSTVALLVGGVVLVKKFA